MSIYLCLSRTQEHFIENLSINLLSSSQFTLIRHTNTYTLTESNGTLEEDSEMTQIGRQHQSTIGPNVFVAIVLVLALSVSVATTMPYNTDCMKNPFASGCRGISAKRSPVQIWPAGAADQLGQTGDTQPQQQRAILYDFISEHQTNKMRSHKLNAVIELLVDATNRLVGLNDWSNMEPSSFGKPLGQTGPPQASDYLAAAAAATKRAHELGKVGQREEARK